MPFGDAEALAAAIDDDTVAVLLEPIQGEAGGGSARRLSTGRPSLCSQRNVPMIADEIQSGLARTGHTFASDHWGVVPEISTYSARPSAAALFYCPRWLPTATFSG